MTFMKVAVGVNIMLQDTLYTGVIYFPALSKFILL
jgi:hypothetical protein